MEGRIVTNEQTGERAWWDGQKLTPATPDQIMGFLSEQKQQVDQLGANLKADPKAAMEAEIANPSPNLGLAADPMAAAKQRSVDEASAFNTKMIQNVGVPLAQAGLGIATGGLSVPLQMGLGGAVELGLQKAGLAPESTGQLAAQTLLPGVGRAVVGGVKAGGRALGNILGKGQMAGEQAMAKRLGALEDPVERAFAPKQSKRLYRAAESQGTVDVTNAQSAIQDAIAKESALGSQADQATLRMLRGIDNDLAAGTMDAETALAKAQRLSAKSSEAFKKGQGGKGATLKDATREFKETIPGTRAADEAFTREQAVEDVFKAARASNKVKALDDLISGKKGDRIKAVISDDEWRDLRKIASQMVDIGGQADAGILKSAYEGTIRSFLADPNGLTVFRHAFGPNLGKMTPAGITGLLTFMRAYNAQKGQ